MTSIIAMASADPDLQIPAGWFRMPFLLWPFERWSTSNLDSSCRSTSRFRPSRFAELAESCGKNGGFHINSPPKNITLDLPEKMMLHRFWGVPWYTMVYHIFREIQRSFIFTRYSSSAKSGTEPGPVRDCFALAKRRAEGCWFQLIQLFGSLEAGFPLGTPASLRRKFVASVPLTSAAQKCWSLESTVDSERFSCIFVAKSKETEVTLAALERWYRFGSPDRGGRRWTHALTMFKPTRLWVDILKWAGWAWKIAAWDFGPVC